MAADRDLIRVRPGVDMQYVSEGRTVLAIGLDGLISEDSSHGLFVHETRMLSRLAYTIDGRAPYPVVTSNVTQHTWLGYYIALPPGIHVEEDTGSGQVSAASQQTLELRISRYVGEGLHEDIDFTNFTQQSTAFRLAVELDADFADWSEVKGRREQSGRLERTWTTVGGRGELRLQYDAEHHYDEQGNLGLARISRALTVRVLRADASPRYEAGVIVFEIQLPAHGTWHACVDFVPEIDGVALPVHGCASLDRPEDEYDRRREIFLSEATAVRAPHAQGLFPVVLAALERAKHDLAALRLYDLDHGARAWTMAAGLPVYIALFGRDTLTAGWQAALLGPEMMTGTLLELERWQGREVNDWRDEQPGRMLHEAHTGPLEALNFNPHARYYGSVTTSAFFPVIVSALWHWTGDRDLVAGLARAALRGIAWLDTYGDLDGDGFYEYQTRSAQGVRNQAWKDSGDAVVYEDGSQVKPPIATCEEQAFVYVGKLHLAEVLWWLGERAEARRLLRAARELKRRFNDAFWLPYEGFFAMGLDADKRPIRSIASNPGHCLAAGIVDAKLAQATADRLVGRDLFSGWGVRTLSAAHPAYNPYSYHRGSIWPVEQATFALGFMRYGLWEHLELIARAQFEATGLFDFYRLPEVFSGHPRDERHPFPALYPQANSPQAWSASAVFCFLQAMLGLYPYAPLRTLFVDPHLPPWLPEITLERLRVGDARVDIRFYRRADGASDYRILGQEGRLHVLRQPSPWSLTATVGERLLDMVTSMLPGR